MIGPSQMLGHDTADDLELALSLLGQGGVVGVAPGQAEHQREDAGLGLAKSI
jgi:hypothetical protein